MVEPRCFLPKIERKLSEDEFFLDWQKCLFKFLMFSPKNRKKIKWRWKFFLIDKNTSSSCLFFGRWGNVASSFYFIFLSLGGPSFFFFFLLHLGSNVIVAIVASLFSYLFIFFFFFFFFFFLFFFFSSSGQ